MIRHLKALLRSAAAPIAQPPSEPTPVVSYVQHILECSSYMSEEEIIHAGRSLLAIALPPEERHLIPVIARREEPPLNTWRVQNELMSWDIHPRERVLDIGSGGWPFRMATHIADMHVAETSHRVETLERDKRPFVAADICNMPYADQSFDFVFCSHVLEHLDDPGKAIREIQRVGRRGYIEVPSRLSDVMMNFTHLANHHRWHGLRLGKTLVLIEWQDEERRSMGTSDFYSKVQSSFQNPFQSFMERNWDMFFVGLKWEKEIGFIVIDKSGGIIDRS